MVYNGNPEEYKGYIEELTEKNRNHADTFNKFFRQMVDNDEALKEEIGAGGKNFSFIMSEPSNGYFTKPQILYFQNHTSGGYVGLVLTRAGTACKIEWQPGRVYGAGTKIYYEEKVYEVTQNATMGTKPPTHVSGIINSLMYIGVKAEFKPFGYISK